VDELTRAHEVAMEGLYDAADRNIILRKQFAK
jgi:hypothetical protein